MRKLFLTLMALTLMFGAIIGCETSPPLPTEASPDEPIDEMTTDMDVPPA